LLDQLVLTRLLSDGRLDSSFGVGGELTTHLGVGIISAFVAIDQEGRIVVVAGATGRGFLVRYNPDGSLDVSLAGNGIIPMDLGGSTVATTWKVGIQSDGKILVAHGMGNTLVPGRYNPDGTLDSSFGTSGQVTTLFASSVTGLEASGILLQGDGSIIVTGSSLSGSSAFSVLARYLPSGTLDTTFGTDGEVVFTNGSFSYGGTLQPDGKILLVTIGGIVRLKPDGSIDNAFGNGGVASVRDRSGGVVGFEAIALTPTGKIVAEAYPYHQLVRFTPDGSQDFAFGDDGFRIVNFSGAPDPYTADFALTALAVQPDGRIIVAGRGYQLLPFSFGLARYLTDNVGTSNQRFVEQLYWDLLRRPVDTAGMVFWTGLLDQGLSRMQVVAAIQNSPEYHTLVVADLYQRVLGRTTDPSGQAYWVSFLDRGGTAEQLEAILLASDEFFVRHGGNNDRGFLPALYQIILQRPIDPAGAQSWGQALQSGALSRQAVAAAVLASLESDRLEVQNLYLHFLHRAPDPTGLDNFTTALQRGLSNEQVAVIFLSSPEYLARA
jgi:uncharacterized delta-60 repeat protein